MPLKSYWVEPQNAPAWARKETPLAEVLAASMPEAAIIACQEYHWVVVRVTDLARISRAGLYDVRSYNAAGQRVKWCPEYRRYILAAEMRRLQRAEPQRFGEGSSRRRRRRRAA